MPTPTYIAIAKTVLTGTQQNVDFLSIPGTYADLLLVVSGRSSGGGLSQSIYLSCNYATTGYASTSFTGLESDGTGTLSGNTYANQGSIPGTGSTTNAFGNAEFYLLNYAGSTRKLISSTTVNESNTTSTISAQARVTAANLNDTNPITTIRVVDSGGGFISGSRFDLYGIKKS